MVALAVTACIGLELNGRAGAQKLLELCNCCQPGFVYVDHNPWDAQLIHRLTAQRPSDSCHVGQSYF